MLREVGGDWQRLAGVDRGGRKRERDTLCGLLREGMLRRTVPELDVKRTRSLLQATLGMIRRDGTEKSFETVKRTATLRRNVPHGWYRVVRLRLSREQLLL
jgi:hypothetical protein